MKKFIYLFICCFCLIMGCKNNKPSNSLEESAEKEVKIETDFSTIIHPNLLKEIKEYTTKDHFIGTRELNVINVLFRRFNKHSHIIISQNPFYYLDYLEGYLIIDDKMVAFSYDDPTYVDRWIDTSKLVIIIPPEKYVDENNFDRLGLGYNFSFKTFKVDDEKMTLELVHSSGY